MERRSFPFFSAYYEAAQHLNAKDRAAFYEAIIHYSFTAEEPILKGQTAMCWILVKPYLEKSMGDFLNGSKGGRPRKSQNPGLPKKENPGFVNTETSVPVFQETNMNMNMNIENEAEQRPPAPPAAVAPHKGALGGRTVLDSTVTPKERDQATEEARRRFFNSMKRPAWAAADAAPPDADTEELEDV